MANSLGAARAGPAGLGRAALCEPLLHAAARRTAMTTVTMAARARRMRSGYGGRLRPWRTANVCITQRRDLKGFRGAGRHSLSSFSMLQPVAELRNSTDNRHGLVAWLHICLPSTRPCRSRPPISTATCDVDALLVRPFDGKRVDPLSVTALLRQPGCCCTRDGGRMRSRKLRIGVALALLCAAEPPRT